MNAIAVETAPDLASEVHIARASGSFHLAVDLNMQAGYELSIAELPDMNMMGFNDSIKRLDVGADFIDAHAHRDGLQEDAASSLAEWDGGAEDDGSDDQGDGWVEVVTARESGQPDDESSDNDTDIAKSISQDMEEDTAHVQITMGVTVAAV